jgi:hypothetical protein
MGITEEQRQAIIEYGEGRYQMGYKDGYVSGIICGILLSGITFLIFSTTKKLA